MITISEISCSSKFKIISGIDIDASSHFFYISTCKENYNFIFEILLKIINSYGQLSVVGFGGENNVYNRSQLIVDKIGYFGQNDFKDFAIKNEINKKIYKSNKFYYFSHYIGPLKSKETFYKFIGNYDKRIYIEIIKNGEEGKLILKKDYVGLNVESSVKLLVGFDVNESIYLILNGDRVNLEKILKNINNEEYKIPCKLISMERVVYIEKNVTEMISLFNLFCL